MTFVPASPETSRACRILTCLEYHAVDGLAQVGTKVIERETGLFRRAVQLTLREMVGAGVLHQLSRSTTSPSSASLYRIARADLVSREATAVKWTEARVALLMRDYPGNAIDRLLGPLNALPGAPITMPMVRTKVVELDLKHTAEFWASGRVFFAERMRRAQKPREPKPPKVRVPRRVTPPPVVKYEPPPEPIPRSSSGMRFASSITSRSFSIDWKALPKLAPRAGCRWPLTCAEPATGAFCVGHRGMLR